MNSSLTGQWNTWIERLFQLFQTTAIKSLTLTDPTARKVPSVSDRFTWLGRLSEYTEALQQSNLYPLEDNLSSHLNSPLGGRFFSGQSSEKLIVLS